MQASLGELKQSSTAAAEAGRVREADLKDQLAQREAAHQAALTAATQAHNHHTTTLKAEHQSALATKEFEHDLAQSKAVRKARADEKVKWPRHARTQLKELEDKMVNHSAERKSELLGLRMRISGGENALNRIPGLEQEINDEIELAEFRLRAGANRAQQRAELYVSSDSD